MHPLQERKNYPCPGYGWLITKDKIDDGNTNGTMGPHDCQFSADEIKSKGAKFRMLDDDGIVYYYGYIHHIDDYFPEYEAGFEPLEDFGTPNAGCTDIQYKNKETGDWESL